jgi:hypothetical protein
MTSMTTISSRSVAPWFFQRPSPGERAKLVTPPKRSVRSCAARCGGYGLKRKAPLVAMCHDLPGQQKKNDMYSPF